MYEGVGATPAERHIESQVMNWFAFLSGFSYKKKTNQPKEMTMFDKKKDVTTEPVQEESKDMTAADAALETKLVELPAELDASLLQLKDELDIFYTRLDGLKNAHLSKASDAVKKRSFSHAKHAALCVRDALKSFGRVKL